MNDRFTRPMSADQINQTLEMLQQAAEKHTASPEVGDLLYKARHVIPLLWRECSLYENLEETAALTFSDVEKPQRLSRKASTRRSSKSTSGGNRLKALINNPPAPFRT